ncbi:hypothetical protein VNI00_001518 [Paramarasmius palmivorus]|uniref:Uncharacterized protein n=1 Tax=Paramarasmius palmivorus TaxID=297713 RepID=A0AAW0E4F3_9AGAR
MPTNTTAHEVLLEIVNDTDAPVWLSKGNVTTTLDRNECLAMVLTAGTTYHYTIGQHAQRTQIMIKSWQNIHEKASRFLNDELTRASPNCRSAEER